MLASHAGKALKALQDGFRRLGYRHELIATDYTVCDWFSEKSVNRTVPLVAFGREPYGYDSACLTAVIANGLRGASLINSVRSVGAPISFEISNEISVWQVGANLASTKRIESFDLTKLPDFLESRKEQFCPGALLRAKNIEPALKEKQFDFIDAGLIPALEHQVREKLDDILSEAATIGSSSFRDRHGKEPNVRELFGLIFRLLAGKIMQDRKVPSFNIADNPHPDVDVILKSVADFYHETPAKYMDKSARRAVCNRIWGSMSLANVSVEVLSYIYENTLIAPSQRQQLGTHSTPYQVARHIVHAIPFENYPIKDIIVLEPCSGHAIFLVAALQRLRELCDLSEVKKRHELFTHALRGFEKDAFAVEVSRLCLMMADFPNPDGWRVYNQDIFTSSDFLDEAKTAKIILANPPFEDFTPQEQSSYQGLTHRQKPIEVLDLVLKHTPADAAIGFVLPKAIINGSNYKEEREALFERFETIEVVSLPDKIFTHSEIETALIIGKVPRTSNKKALHLVFKEVLPEDKAAFLDRGAISWKEEVKLTEDQARKSLYVPANLEIWQKLASYTQLETVADLHRGVEWKSPFNQNAFVSSQSKAGWWPGYRRLKASGSTGTEDEIDARVKTAVAPIARQLEAANAELAQAKIGQAIIAAASKNGVLSTAIDDVVTRGMGVFKLEQGRIVPYINGEKAYGPSGDLMTVEQFVARLVDKAPHLFGKEDGTGGATFHGLNPWKPENRNLTRQAEILKRDRPLARRLAQEAGVKVTF